MAHLPWINAVIRSLWTLALTCLYYSESLKARKIAFWQQLKISTLLKPQLVQGWLWSLYSPPLCPFLLSGSLLCRCCEDWCGSRQEAASHCKSNIKIRKAIITVTNREALHNQRNSSFNGSFRSISYWKESFFFFPPTSQLFCNWKLKDSNNSCIRTQKLNSIWYLNFLTWASSKETNVRKAQVSPANSAKIVQSAFLFDKIHYEVI